VKRKYIYLLLIIVSASVLYRGWLSDGEDYLHLWDEKFHALTAKNLATSYDVPRLYTQPVFDYDYRDWTRNEIWLHKPPAFLYPMAWSIAALGPSILAVRLPSMIYGALIVLMIYFLGLKLWNRQIALWTSLLSAFSFHISMTMVGAIATDHNDMAFLFWSTVLYTASVSFPKKKILASIVICMATSMLFLTKWILAIPAILVAGTIYYLCSGKRNSLVYVSSILSGFILPTIWLVAMYVSYPLETKFELLQIWNHAIQEIEGHPSSIFFYFGTVFDYYGPFLFISWIYFLYHNRNALREHFARLILFILGPIFGFLALGLLDTAMPNYVIFIAPVLWMSMAWFLEETRLRLINQENLSTLIRSIRIILYTSMVSLVIWTITKPDVLINYLHQSQPSHFIRIDHRYASIVNTDAIKELKLNPDKIIFYDAPHALHIDLMYFHDITAYPKLPTDQQREILKTKNKGTLCIVAEDIPDKTTYCDSVIIDTSLLLF